MKVIFRLPLGTWFPLLLGSGGSCHMPESTILLVLKVLSLGLGV
jgi:hypothetical protein